MTVSQKINSKATNLIQQSRYGFKPKENEVNSRREICNFMFTVAFFHKTRNGSMLIESVEIEIDDWIKKNTHRHSVKYHSVIKFV